MTLLPQHLVDLPALPLEVAERAREEFSELPQDLRQEIIDASGHSTAVLQSLRGGDWVELRRALQELQDSMPDNGYDRLVTEVLQNLG